MTELCFEMFTTLTGERDTASQIQAFFFLSGGPLGEGNIEQRYGGSYDAILAQAPQLAPLMDEFLAAHGGVTWNAQSSKYNLSSAQTQALFPVDDLNTTRSYCTLPAINIRQTLTNIARLFRNWGNKSGEITRVRTALVEAMALMRGTGEGKSKESSS